MKRVSIETPSRLHFGLLGWGPEAPRQFGGVGLMIEAPGIGLTAEPASIWGAEGPLKDRVLRVARRVEETLKTGPLQFQIRHAPREHLGLGVGTQVSLAVTRALLSVAGESDPTVERLAALSERGLRSGIGLHGFRAGALIVDGGRGPQGTIPPLLARLEFPSEWSVLVIIPEHSPGLHGPEEANAFAQLPPIPTRVTERLCRIVLLGMLPAVCDRDIETFGRSLTELQEAVGQCFAPAQGGILARPESVAIVDWLRAEGFHGVGQSSWGPTLYAFAKLEGEERARLAKRLCDRFTLGSHAVFWTTASRTGAVLKTTCL